MEGSKLYNKMFLRGWFIDSRSCCRSLDGVILHHLAANKHNHSTNSPRQPQLTSYSQSGQSQAPSIFCLWRHRHHRVFITLRLSKFENNNTKVTLFSADNDDAPQWDE